MRQTIAGIGHVDMLPNEITKRKVEIAEWEAERAKPKPPKIETRLAAIEEKLGITHTQLKDN